MTAVRTLRIYINERDRWQGRPLHEALVEKFREVGVAGATVMRGAKAFGQSGIFHPEGRLGLSGDLPVMISVVDAPDRIDVLLPVLDKMIFSGIATITHSEKR